MKYSAKPKIFSLFSLVASVMLAVLLLAGCTSQYLVPLDDRNIAEKKVSAISKSQDGVEVTVLPSIWEGNPYYLKHYITPVYIEIKNTGENDITFDYTDSALITDANIQYSPLSPQNVSGILSSSGKQPRPVLLASSIRFGFGFGRFHRFGYYNHFHPFRHHFHSPFYYNDYYYPERAVDTSDIYSKAITPASIRPGATLNGYMYFKKLPEEVRMVTLQVSYSASGESEKRYIDFPFSVIVTRN